MEGSSAFGVNSVSESDIAYVGGTSKTSPASGISGEHGQCIVQERDEANTAGSKNASKKQYRRRDSGQRILSRKIKKELDAQDSIATILPTKAHENRLI